MRQLVLAVVVAALCIGVRASSRPVYAQTESYGRIDGVVTTRGALGNTWSLQGTLIQLWTMTSDPLQVHEVAESAIGADNIFGFDNVLPGAWYWVVFPALDYTAGACDDPSVFAVAAGEISVVNLFCRR